MMKINILGTEYDIILEDPADDPKLKDCDGYTDTSVKKLVVDSMDSHKDDPGRKSDLAYYQRQVLRHEIIHAFLFESGLDASCSWAANEEAIDWIAIQLPKLAAVMKEGGLL